MKKFKLKKGDQIIVIAGKDKGKKAEISKVIKSKDRVIVRGVNLAKKHIKPDPQKGVVAEIKSIEKPIHISNVAFYDNDTGKPSKIGYKFDKDGNKKRFAKKSGQFI